jgi:threonyl-tRNA synthetase
MHVQLPDGSQLELPEGASGLDAARSIGPRLAEQAVGVRVDGDLRDLRLSLEDGQRIEILTTRDADDPDALTVLRHSASHLLAEAVRRLYPGVKVAIGPAIENGFYYDFDFPSPIVEEDLARIEEEIKRELAEGREWRREELERDEARSLFAKQEEPYKVELVDDAEGNISLYTQGDFTDLCRGPHLIDSGPIKALELTGLAGAYWRGDSANKQLTRIYGTAFFSKKDLEAYLARVEEAKKRDHRRLGVQLDLFHFDEHSPGSAFWHPKGMVIWNAFEDLRRRENARRGYVEVKTPVVFDSALWETSGHWEKFREQMFFFEAEGRTFGLKPMNCPGHCLIFGDRAWSYRDLPLRMAEAGTLHRDEPSGVLHGLLRVRTMHQDDAHLFCTPEQIEEEVAGCLDYLTFLLGALGFDPSFELSTRPDQKLGSDEDWDRAEAALAGALDGLDLSYELNPGDGAFYGPKIDVHIRDSLGRGWQISTIQLDYQMPKRFGLSYVGADNAKHTPVMIHRAIFGTFERFIGILLEHTGGDLPLWLAPLQLRVIPVGENHAAAARAIVEGLRKADFRADLDDRGESVGRRIRDAELEKIPRVVVYGDKESAEDLAVREHGGAQSRKSLKELVIELTPLALPPSS